MHLEYLLAANSTARQAIPYIAPRHYNCSGNGLMRLLAPSGAKRNDDDDDDDDDDDYNCNYQIISALLWNNQFALRVSQGTDSQAVAVHKHITKIFRG